MLAKLYTGTLLGLLLAPFLSGMVNRTKAVFAGRHGAPLFQMYFDIWKLLRKGEVYSRTTTWIFRAAPVVCLSSVMAAMLLVPVVGFKAPISFRGDIILFAYLLGLMRFFMVLAALDTGSSFEGMGASREVLFSALAEPALIIGVATLAFISGSVSLSGMFVSISGDVWTYAGPALIMVAASMVIVFLVENARIPFDDPNTHLELTMIHEVMILDYTGPDLAIVLYAASLKMWILGALIVNVLLASTGITGWFGVLMFTVGMLVLAVAVGVIESVMARLSLLKAPCLLVGAGALSVLAYTLALRFTA